MKAKASDTFYCFALNPDKYPMRGMGSTQKRREGHKLNRQHMRRKWKRKGYAAKYIKKHGLEEELVETEMFYLSLIPS